MAVVLAVAILVALGLRGDELFWLEGRSPVLAFFFRFNVVVMGWLVWSFIASVFGGWIFHGEGGRSGPLRAIGIATAPGALLVFSNIDTPLMGQTVGEAVRLFGLLWMLVIGTQAIKETMRLAWIHAAIPGFVGWFVAWLLLPNLLLFTADGETTQTPPPAENATSTAQLP